MLIKYSVLIKLIAFLLVTLLVGLIECSSLTQRDNELDNGIVSGDPRGHRGPSSGLSHGLSHGSSRPLVNDRIEPSTQSVTNEKSSSSNQMRRMLAGLPGGRRLGRLSGHASREEVEALRQLFASQPEQDWSQFTSPPVTEPNCYVEVQVTQKMPGKCTKLGGAIPACQAQDLITFDSACE